MQIDLFNQDLVQDINGELLVSSLIIASNVDYEHQSVIRLINSYKKEFEQLRPIDLKSSGINGTSSYQTWYELDENQVTFLLQLMKNNQYTVKFKLALTKAFSIMKQQVFKNTLPTPLETAKMLVQVLEEKEELLLTNKALEKQNTILMHTNNTYTATELAKELGFKSATILNQKLSDMKIQYKVNNSWVFYSKYADMGYTSIKQHILENGKEIYDRKFTQTGRDFILKLFESEI